MEQLLEWILGGGLRLSLFDPDVLELDQELPRSEMLALLNLQRRGEATMSDLAGDLGAPLSTVTGIGTRLARRGLVERRRDAKDRRVILVRLTPQGLELAGRLRRSLKAILDRIAEVLTPEETEQLMGLAQKVLLALQTRPEAPAAAEGAGPLRIPIED